MFVVNFAIEAHLFECVHCGRHGTGHSHFCNLRTVGEDRLTIYIYMKHMDPTCVTTQLLDLPDEILQICFALLPLEYLPRVSVVCKRWHKLSDGKLLHRIRKRLGVMQTFTFMFQNEYVGNKYQGLQGRAIGAQSRKGHPVATLHGPHRLQYGAAGADGLVYIAGGRSPLRCRKSLKAWIVYSRVDVYEPLSNSWSEMQSMHVARYGFATGAFVNLAGRVKIIVAGGYGAEGEAVSSAEIYDVGKDHWETIPSMRTISGPCKGEVFEGKFHVQQANGGSDTIEIYESSSCKWGAYDSKLSRFSLELKDSTERNGTCKSITLDL